VARYPYLGTTDLFYTQYMDAGAGRPLEASPGHAYEIAPAPGNEELPVPPADGRWSPDPETDPDPVEHAPEPAVSTARTKKGAQA